MEEAVSLQKREIVTIAVGAAILVVGLAAVGVKKLAERASAGGIEATMARIDRIEALRASVDQLVRDLRVDITPGAPGDQESAIVDDIGGRARAAGLEYSSLKPVATSSRSSKRATSGPVQFRMEVSGSIESLMEFADGLEKSRLPYALRELRIDSATRAPRQDPFIPYDEEEEDPGPPPPGNGKVRASLKIQSYIFPRITERG